jgi:hypothetical protein
MSHRVEVVIDDQAVDVRYYCSDTCAKTDPEYDGWNGCSDVFEPAICACGEKLPWYRWNYETHDQEYVLPEAKDWAVT